MTPFLRFVRLASLASIFAILFSMLPVSSEAGSHSRDCYRELRKRAEFRTFTSAIRKTGLVRKVRKMRRVACIAPRNGAFYSNPIHKIDDRLILRSRIRNHFFPRRDLLDLVPGEIDQAGRKIHAGRNVIVPARVVLVPENPADRTLLEVIYEDPYLVLFSELIRKSGLAGLLVQDLQEYTVFAPNDAALLQVAPYLQDLSSIELRHIVLDHIVRGLFETDEFRTRTRLFPLSFRFLDVFVRGDLIVIENAPINLDYADIEAVNGVLHEVHEVILVEP
jgi:uncharacterized surface protein with fasciclin (FAS1) repeats